MKKILYIFPLVAQLAFAQTSPKNVGINTNTPQSALDVNGNVRLEVANKVEPTSHYYNLMKDTNTHELVVQDDTYKTFNHASYDVKTTMGEDWLFDVNTNVPANKYTGVIVMSYFYNARSVYQIDGQKNPEYIENSVYGISHKDTNRNEGNLAETVKLTKGSDKNWHFSADYDFVRPFASRKGVKDLNTLKDDSKHFHWAFDILFIDNSIIEDLGDLEDKVSLP
ncbi:hypothetical protein [Ornithobacterium rhinotracheale]|uniref:hypothetical protein n=1 Tax=Ornithobacterium rhinotracheale TaxID=28251 RepID=UPI0040361031